jgi:hypothetical protein
LHSLVFFLNIFFNKKMLLTTSIVRYSLEVGSSGSQCWLAEADPRGAYFQNPLLPGNCSA